MKIIIEGSALEKRGTGVSRYLINLLDLWLKNYSHKFYILIKDDNIISNIKAHYIYLPYFQKRNLLWQQLIIPKIVNQINDGVYFAPNYTLPLSINIPSILAIHDLSFFKYKQHTLLKNGLLKILVKKSIMKATKCITISDFIKREILDYFKEIDRNKIEVIYLGCQSNFYQDIDEGKLEEVKQKYNILGDFLLSVGLIFNRRCPEKLLNVFKKLIEGCNLNLYLVIIGENRTIPRLNLKELVSNLGISGKVIFIPYVEEEELRIFYRLCKALIYFSDYEGFGLPILEALASRKKVICSDIEVFHEIYKEGCFYVNHNENDEIIAQRIYEILLREEGIIKYSKWIDEYKWEKTADKTMKILTSLFH